MKMSVLTRHSGKMAPLKSIVMGRELWSYAYVGLAILLVTYHGGTVATEKRAARASELRMCKGLRVALDARCAHSCRPGAINSPLLCAATTALLAIPSQEEAPRCSSIGLTLRVAPHLLTACHV